MGKAKTKAKAGYDLLKDKDLMEYIKSEKENPGSGGWRTSKERTEDFVRLAKDSGLIQDTTTKEGRMEFLKRQKEYWNRQKSRPGDPVLGNGEHAGRQFDNPKYGKLYKLGQEHSKAAFQAYHKDRIETARRYADDAAKTRDSEFDRLIKAGRMKDRDDFIHVGQNVGDELWAREKNRVEAARVGEQKAIESAGGSPRKLPAMGGVQFTGPNNTPFRAGSGNKRLVQEYAMAKAREANEHAMYVADRSARLKAEKEDRIARAEYLRRNYTLYQNETLKQRLAEQAMKRENAAMQAVVTAQAAGYRLDDGAKTGSDITPSKAGPSKPSSETPVSPPTWDGQQTSGPDDALLPAAEQEEKAPGTSRYNVLYN